MLYKVTQCVGYISANIRPHSATLGDRVSQTIKIWNVVIQTDKVGYLDSLLTMWCMYGGDLHNYNMLNQQRKLSYTTIKQCNTT